MPESFVPRAVCSVFISALLIATLLEATPARAAFLGESGFLGFQSNRSGTTQAYVVNPDGSGVHQLATIPGLSTYDVAWSADGSKLVFSACCLSGDYEIYSVNADGSALTRLTTNSARDTLPTWAPSGDRIAFTSDRDGNKEIYMMNADGSGQTNLTNHAHTNENPSWSPDGTRIAFDTDRGGNFEIYTMKVDGTGQTNISDSATSSDTEPTWNPTGLSIAFQSNRDGDAEIFTMDSEGGSQTALTANTSSDERPAWSPDGTRIAFDTKRGTNFEVYVMDADGSNQINVSNNSKTDQRPDWQPLLPGDGVMEVTDTGFSPAQVNVKRGQVVEWDFTGSARHSATDSTGMGLFGSGSAAPGGAYAFLFIAAGTYGVSDAFSTNTALVKVPVMADPQTGDINTVFTITWSSATALPGFVFDVQIKRPGSNQFQNWKLSQTESSGTFLPDAGVGDYRFRARLRNTVNGAASGFSNASKITVS